MMAASFKAQLLGYSLVDLQSRVRSVHVGGFSYMRVKKLQQTHGAKQEKWLTRLRFNSGVLSFFESLGWGEWIDPTYSARIREMDEFVQSDRRLHKRYQRLPLTPDEKGFRQSIVPLADGATTRH